MDYHYLNQFPKPLLESILQDRCVPFIGSGFSKNADVPSGKNMLDWDELGMAFAKEMENYKYSNAIDAISAYSYAYSRPVMVEKMKSLLLTGEVKTGNTHKAFCKLQFDIVCTTNFDRLLESTYDFLKRPCNAIINESQLSVAPSKDEVTLLKMHGDIYHPDRIVATEEDYDKFLDENPMLATYLSNLLITRTPLFIGYSLEDDDFRQIWQIVKNRLGRLRRQAYVIKVNCSDTERKRFERRGVAVVNITGNPNDYPHILATIFAELKAYWDDSVKVVGESSAQSELALPADSQNRLCFFSVPLRFMPVYKEYFFPIATRYGFVPITADSVVSVSDNWMAKVSSLISKSEYFVCDINSNNTAYEFGQILNMIKKKDNILILRDETIGLSNHASFNIINKPLDFYENPEKVLENVEKWFQKLADKAKNRTEQEPERLLNKNEYRAAVISAVVLLEVELRNRVEKENKDVNNNSLYMLSKMAKELGVINQKDMDTIRKWINLRNLLVHSDYAIDGEYAKIVVNEIIKFIKVLRK